MRIELERAWAPDELGEEECPICEQRFMTESVRAVARGPLEGHVCPSCVAHMGSHPSGRFPTIEEYEDAKRRFPEPVWASGDDLDREDPAWAYTPEVSQLPRA